MAKLTRKPCDFPGCNHTTPVTWRFCRDSRCQSRRFIVWQLGEGTTEQQAVLQQKFDHDRAQEKKWAKNALGYRRNWKRKRRRSLTAFERRIILENSAFRSEQNHLIWETASPELRELIEQQKKDGYQVGRFKGDPWNMASLDAPLGGEDDFTLSDLIEDGSQIRGSWTQVAWSDVEWSDPTFWAALPELDIWVEEVQRRKRIGDPSFSDVRYRPAPEPLIQRRINQKRRVA